MDVGEPHSLLASRYLTFVLLCTFTTSGGALLVQGLHDRVMHGYKLDDLRQFAKEVDAAGFLKNTYGINHGDISDLSDEQKKTFAHIRAKYPFMHWMDDGSILHGPSILNQGNANEVDFEWGGALPGHWGCSISINGAKNDPDSAHFKSLPVSDDIYFFIDAG